MSGGNPRDQTGTAKAMPYLPTYLARDTNPPSLGSACHITTGGQGSFYYAPLSYKLKLIRFIFEYD